MRLLVTNDDGIDSAGLHALVAALDGAGHDLVVVAPHQDFSGAGASLGGFGRLDIRVARATLPGLEHVEAHSLEGPPGMCVLAVQLGAFGDRPDYVIAGINPGYNLGRATLHSGTVGAALTAQNFGSGGLAISTGPLAQLADDSSIGASGTAGSAELRHFGAAADQAVAVLPLLFASPPQTVLNLNVPVGYGSLPRGVRWAELASFGEVQTAASVEDEVLQLRFAVPNADPHPQSDQGLVASGYATLSMLAGITAAWVPTGASAGDEVDLTASLSVS